MRRTVLLLSTTLLLLTVVCTSAAWATTFTVTNTNDSGSGSLRAAIKQANANAGADEIVFADGVSGTITLASPLPDVTDVEGLAIDGGGDVTVSGNEAVGIIRVFGGSLALSKLTLVKGAGFPESIGATDRLGGAIDNRGTLELTNVTFSDNRITGSFPQGGAIHNGPSGTLTVTNSTFSGNSSNGSFPQGGAIFNFFGTLTVTNSTFSGNSSNNGDGGGIYNDSGTVNLTNSTFSGNSAGGGGEGGGIYNIFSGTVNVTNSTFSNNSAWSGGNCFAVDVDSPISDGGYNIEDGGSCGFTEATGSLSNTNPLLDPAGLQDNGGPTQTIALQPDSPAVDLVGQGACPPPTTDQRGIERPQGAACDSGAFELEEPDSTPPSVTSTSPKANATEVAPTANIRATFSVEMDSKTIDGTTVKLFKKGTTTQIPATVSYNANTDTAKLDPTNNLRRGVAYKAVVTTWATDVAGNRLDQDRSTSGFQQMRWFFRVDD